MKKQMKTYWMSFAKYNQQLGCCIVDAENEIMAITKSHQLGINPSGEVMFFELPDDEDGREEINKWGKNVFITPDELKKEGYSKLSDLDENTKGLIEDHDCVSVVCKNHNVK